MESKKPCKAGRKPIYTEERTRLSFRASKELSDDLNKLVAIKKKDNKDFTLNEYIVSVLSEKVGFDLFQLRKK